MLRNSVSLSLWSKVLSRMIIDDTDDDEDVLTERVAMTAELVTTGQSLETHSILKKKHDLLNECALALSLLSQSTQLNCSRIVVMSALTPQSLVPLKTQLGLGGIVAFKAPLHPLPIPSLLFLSLSLLPRFLLSLLCLSCISYTPPPKLW